MAEHILVVDDEKEIADLIELPSLPLCKRGRSLNQELSGQHNAENKIFFKNASICACIFCCIMILLFCWHVRTF